MKFTPRPDYGQFNDTHRKRLAVERNQSRQVEALPLFAEIIREGLPTVDAVMMQRAREWTETEQRDRDRMAAKWRGLRRDIQALPPEFRAEIADRAASYGGPLNTIAYSYFYKETTGYHPPSLDHITTT